MKNIFTKHCALCLTLLLLLLCFNGCKQDSTGSVDTESTVSTPTSSISSGNSVLDLNPNKTSKPSSSSSSKPQKTSSNANSSKKEETKIEVDRAEKVVKTYKFEDEFFAPRYDKLVFNDSQTGKVLPYSLHIPENYSKNKKYPVLFFLHGMGAQGTDYVSANGEFATIYKHNGDLVNNSIVLIPQTTGWWYAHESGQDDGWLGVAMRLLYQIEATYSCDRDRIYVMGLSMGGYGTWNALQYYGDHFAAGVPICGGGDPYFAKELTDIPIWIYHGENDDTVSIQQSEAMYFAIVNAGGEKIHFTRLPGVKHDSWLNAFESRELLSWLYSQNKSTNPTSEFEYIPYFKITNPQGKTVVTEFDATNLSIYSIEDHDYFEFSLSDDGLKKLTRAYQGAIGKKFDVYYGTQKLLTFTPTKKPVDELFTIDNVFTTENYYWYFKRITDIGIY